MITVLNLQRRVALDLAWLRRFAEVAWEETSRHSADGAFALRSIEEVSVAVVSDRRIAEIHRDFMGIKGATDVITFEHGDIVISAETARAYAAGHGQSLEHELGLYVLHGLLHLQGFDDRTVEDRRRMHRRQDRLLKTCLRRLTHK